MDYYNGSQMNQKCETRIQSNEGYALEKSKKVVRRQVFLRAIWGGGYLEMIVI